MPVRVIHKLTDTEEWIISNFKYGTKIERADRHLCVCNENGVLEKIYGSTWDVYEMPTSIVVVETERLSDWFRENPLP